MVNPKTLLIVDDETDIQRLIERFFTRQGFKVLRAGSGAEMFPLLATQPVDVVLLDVCLPGQSGFELLPQIKQAYHAAVIMLTSQGDTDQRVAGLTQGADDYLPKPFDLAELHARIIAVLRRYDSTANNPLTANRYQFAEFTLDAPTRQLIDAKGRDIKLTPAEYDLLLVFLKNAGVVLDRDFLMLHTRGRVSSAYDRTIDVRLSQLRKKLRTNATTPLAFTTIRGGGYMLECDVKTAES